jgi:AraC family transcriptional regulator, transcriptional activator of pobA
MNKLFRIFEIDSRLAGEISSGPKLDHFHDFEELIILSSGNLKHYIDFRADEVTGPFACYISMGKTHRLEPEANIRGWVINYKTEFIPDSRLSFYSNFLTFTNIPLSSGVVLDRYLGVCRSIDAEYNYRHTDNNTLRHLVNALITMLEGQMRLNLPDASLTNPEQSIAFNSFLKILEANFRRNEGVSFYAARLNMSEKKLNLICRGNFQMNVSEIIETRKLIEAKRMLIYSQKTISEIGFEIGYNEKSYFTRIFHARTGMTPSAYREKIKSMNA